MRDLLVATLLLAAFGYTLARPWYGVLMLAFLSFMSPQAYCYGFMRHAPIYMVAFGVATIAMLGARDRQRLPNDWRIGTFYALWFYFLITTLDAEVPQQAWTKLTEVSKIYLPLLYTLMLIHTRERLLTLIGTIATAIGIIATKGGIFAIGKGFSHRVWGPDGTMYGGNNEFAIATLMAIPLLLLWQAETTRREIRLGLLVVIPLCFASALCSWSRGALLSMCVLSVLLLLHSKRKALALPLMVIGAVLAAGVLPEEWYGRMDTISTYDEDGSAMGRINTWIDGINYALAHPITGAGFDGWIVVSRRDWHSAYVEALAEHGFVGAALWGSLVFGSMINLTRLGMLGQTRRDLDWLPRYAYMLRASLVAYAVGALFLGITYWDLLYQLVFCSILLSQFAAEALRKPQEASATAEGVAASALPLPLPKRPRSIYEPHAPLLKALPKPARGLKP